MFWSGSGLWVALCNLVGGGIGIAAALFSHQPDNIAGVIFFVLWGAISAVLIHFTAKMVGSKRARLRTEDAAGDAPHPGDTFDGLRMETYVWLNPLACAAMAVACYLGYFNPMQYFRI